MFGVFCKRPRKCRPTIMLEQLEDLIVLDATVDAAAQDNQDANVEGNPEQTAPEQATPGQIEGAQDQASDQSDPIDDIIGQDLNVVLISNALNEIEALSDAAEDGAQVIVYDAEQDDLSDLVSELLTLVDSTGQEIGHLAVVSHGAAGALSLGNDVWTLESLQAESSEWAGLGELLTQDARIDLYGCSIGQGEDGGLFVATLASITGATVWASDDATGNVEGSDWDLEVQTGESSMAPLIVYSDLEGTSILLPWSTAVTAGDDTITGTGACPALDALTGNDTITLETGGTVSGNVDGNTGNDTITNSGRVNRDILRGEGDDTVAIGQGGKVGGLIDGGDPNTYPGDTLNILFTAFSNLTGDASAGSLVDQDGDTLRRQNFEEPDSIVVSNMDDRISFEWPQEVSFERTTVPVDFHMTLLSASLPLLHSGEDVTPADADLTARSGEPTPGKTAGRPCAGDGQHVLYEDPVNTGRRPDDSLELAEFLARLREREIGEGLEDIRLAFNAREIELAEWFDSRMASSEWPDELNAKEMVHSDRSAGSWLQGNSLVLDLDDMRVAHLLTSGSESSLVEKLSGASARSEERVTKVF